MQLARLTSMPGHLIRRAQQISSAIFAEELAESELTSVQLVALVAIIDQPGLDATRLAELIDFDKATIGGVIERLERKGLVERRLSKTDKRVKQLAPTPAGRAMTIASLPALDRVQARILSPLGDEDRATFLRLLAMVTGQPDP